MVRPFFGEHGGCVPKGEICSPLVEEGPCRGGRGSRSSGRAFGGFGGVYGVVAGGADLAIRVDPLQLDGQGLEEALKKKAVELKERKPGVRWWDRECGGAGLVGHPAADREVWDVPGWGVPPCKGAFRSRIFFEAAGEPGKRQLDEGGWGDTSPHQRSGPASGGDGGCGGRLVRGRCRE